MTTLSTQTYGEGDATYQAAGGEQGLRQLVDSFYEHMGQNPEFATIWSWHPDDKNITRDKLARFLCAWTGGPRLYNEKYGPISIPQVHKHLKVTAAERDQWLNCMALALNDQGYPQGLRDYLLTQLGIPAERVRLVSERTHNPQASI